MMFYSFSTKTKATAYASAVQAELSKGKGYIAERWSDVYTGSDGRYYVYAHPQTVPAGSTYIEQTDDEGNVHQALQLPSTVTTANDIPNDHADEL
jgi:hypothetical protein